MIIIKKNSKFYNLAEHLQKDRETPVKNQWLRVFEEY